MLAAAVFQTALMRRSQSIPTTCPSRFAETVEVSLKLVSPTPRLTLETVDFDNRDEVDAFLRLIIDAGRILVQADIAKLQAMGYMDSEGNSLSDELPEDMREGSERDEGG